MHQSSKEGFSRLDVATFDVGTLSPNRPETSVLCTQALEVAQTCSSNSRLIVDGSWSTLVRPATHSAPSSLPQLEMLVTPHSLSIVYDQSGAGSHKSGMSGPSGASFRSDGSPSLRTALG